MILATAHPQDVALYHKEQAKGKTVHADEAQRGSGFCHIGVAGNPFEDPAALKRVATVVKGGCWVKYEDPSSEGACVLDGRIPA